MRSNPSKPHRSTRHNPVGTIQNQVTGGQSGAVDDKQIKDKNCRPSSGATDDDDVSYCNSVWSLSSFNTDSIFTSRSMVGAGGGGNLGSLLGGDCSKQRDPAPPNVMVQIHDSGNTRAAATDGIEKGHEKGDSTTEDPSLEDIFVDDVLGIYPISDYPNDHNDVTSGDQIEVVVTHSQYGDKIEKVEECDRNNTCSGVIMQKETNHPYGRLVQIQRPLQRLLLIVTMLTIVSASISIAVAMAERHQKQQQMENQTESKDVTVTSSLTMSERNELLSGSRPTFAPMEPYDPTIFPTFGPPSQPSATPSPRSPTRIVGNPFQSSSEDRLPSSRPSSIPSVHFTRTVAPTSSQHGDVLHTGVPASTDTETTTPPLSRGPLSTSLPSTTPTSSLVPSLVPKQPKKTKIDVHDEDDESISPVFSPVIPPSYRRRYDRHR